MFYVLYMEESRDKDLWVWIMSVEIRIRDNGGQNAFNYGSATIKSVWILNKMPKIIRVR